MFTISLLVERGRWDIVLVFKRVGGKRPSKQRTNRFWV